MLRAFPANAVSYFAVLPECFCDCMLRERRCYVHLAMCMTLHIMSIPPPIYHCYFFCPLPLVCIWSSLFWMQDCILWLYG